MSTAPSERSQVTVRLDGPTWARLEREALQDRRPVASLARLLIVRRPGGSRAPGRAREPIEGRMPMNTTFSPAGMALGLGSIPGLTSELPA